MKQPNFRKCVISLTLSVSLLTGSALATAKANNWYAIPLQMQQQNQVLLKPQYQAVLSQKIEIKAQKENPLALAQPASPEPKPSAPDQPVALKATLKAAKQTTEKQVTKPVQAKKSAPLVRLMKSEIAGDKQDSTAAKKEIATTNKARTLETPSGKTITYSRLIPVKASAYTAAAEENGLWGAFDFMGNPLKLGTIAVDPDVIPMGSTVFVTGYSFDGLPANGMIAKATDQGSSVRGKRVDIFIPTSRADATKFGLQDVKVYIIE